MPIQPRLPSALLKSEERVFQLGEAILRLELGSVSLRKAHLAAQASASGWQWNGGNELGNGHRRSRPLTPLRVGLS
jgi:hypothetical protein